MEGKPHGVRALAFQAAIAVAMGLLFVPVTYSTLRIVHKLVASDEPAPAPMDVVARGAIVAVVAVPLAFVAARRDRKRATGALRLLLGVAALLITAQAILVR